jgi:hypothetical protein
MSKDFLRKTKSPAAKAGKNRLVEKQKKLIHRNYQILLVRSQTLIDISTITSFFNLSFSVD